MYTCIDHLSGHIVIVVTYATATDATSVRSLLSGQASSLLGVDWVVPGRGPSGPEDWGPAGDVGVLAEGVMVGGATSVVCCRSWAEEVSVVTGLGGAGEEEEEEESAGEAELC